jgi:diguanylate cyclase (GGDEF)-like protein
MAKILVIEDMAPVREEILRILHSAGYETVAAENGRVGLERAREQPPDLILCDVMMPELDGYGVLTEVRADPELRRTPFIFLTALDTRTEMRRGMNLGADDYVAKPFRIRELLDAVRSRLERHVALARASEPAASPESQPIPAEGLYDELTGLPNRRMLQEWLTQCIAIHEGGPVFGLLLIDLDRFRHLHDALGQLACDRVLKLVSERLRAGCAKLFRSASSEFVTVIPHLSADRTASSAAAELLQRVKQPLSLGEHVLHLTASAGISLYPTHGEDPDALLDHARLAMRHAKEQGRNTLEFFQPTMQERAWDRVTLENGLRQALERGSLALHYQPQVDLNTGRISGMEALARWMHPELGPISPTRFIPVAEDSGLVLPLGDWTLRTACAQARAFQDLGFPGLRVGVNVSDQQFQDPDIVHKVQDAIRATSLEPRCLELELTECAILRNPGSTIAKLDELKDLGVLVSIDDFGTGLASVADLRRFPLDALKIDQSFVRDVASGQEGMAVAKAIIELAHGLELEVVAEGVETGEQVGILREQRCDGMQGYYFSPPLPADGFLRLLQEDRRLA